ncbi:hypothetical protein FACS189496_4080 [Bacilli bacterium]|nr:hypothetical protein FACS189496_4050 [Bacilli bacterium]GHU53065.1 hypothetical protein FACS189496_4080 [Bacilli bacterium]
MFKNAVKKLLANKYYKIMFYIFILALSTIAIMAGAYLVRDGNNSLLILGIILLSLGGLFFISTIIIVFFHKVKINFKIIACISINLLCLIPIIFGIKILDFKDKLEINIICIFAIIMSFVLIILTWYKFKKTNMYKKDTEIKEQSK